MVLKGNPLEKQCRKEPIVWLNLCFRSMVALARLRGEAQT
jgi:hypothetical protein